MRLKINTKAKLSSVCEAACILIVVGGILAGYSEELERITDWSIVILGIFVLIYTLLNNRIKTIELLPMILCLALGLVNCIFIHQNALQIYIIISCAYYPVTLFLLHSKKLHTGWWAAYAVLMAAFIMFYWLNSPDGYLLFYKTSRNYVSVFLLEITFLLTYVYYLEGKRLHILVYVGVFICCVSAIGRMGIISSGFLLFCIFVYRTFSNKDLSKFQKIRNIVGGIIITLILVVIFIRYSDYIFDNYLSRFISNNYYSDLARNNITNSYLKEMKTFKGFILGANSHRISYLTRWNGNIHNSYLMTHAAFGIVGLVSLVAGFIFSSIILLKERNIDLLVIVAAFAMRMYSDNTLNGQLGDVIAMFVIILPLMHSIRDKTLHFKIR